MGLLVPGGSIPAGGEVWGTWVVRGLNLPT